MASQVGKYRLISQYPSISYPITPSPAKHPGLSESFLQITYSLSFSIQKKNKNPQPRHGSVVSGKTVKNLNAYHITSHSTGPHEGLSIEHALPCLTTTESDGIHFSKLVYAFASGSASEGVAGKGLLIYDSSTSNEHHYQPILSVLRPLHRCWTSCFKAGDILERRVLTCHDSFSITYSFVIVTNFAS